jgi:hypothetical protein
MSNYNELPVIFGGHILCTFNTKTNTIENVSIDTCKYMSNACPSNNKYTPGYMATCVLTNGIIINIFFAKKYVSFHYHDDSGSGIHVSHYEEPKL